MSNDLNPRKDYKEKRRKENFELIGTTALIAFTIGGVVLTSCAKNSKKDEESVVPTEQVDLENILMGEVNPDSVKTFEEGEHVLSVRVTYGLNHNKDLTGYVINNMPEGYEVFQVTPSIDYVGYHYGSATNGYDIWFKNTEPVEVHATYNEALEQYGYFTFGEVIEEEKVLEK